MIANERRFSARQSIKASNELKKLLDKMGNINHPRGFVLRAYRNAIRSASVAIKRKDRNLAFLELREVFDSLKAELNLETFNTLKAARDLGELKAKLEMRSWGIDFDPIFQYSMVPAYEAWINILNQQELEALAVFVNHQDDVLLGDDKTPGLIRPDRYIRPGSLWLLRVLMGAYFFHWDSYLQSNNLKNEWGKQAIPAIDLSTTDCCLQVAGQVVPFDKKFRLTGTPRFADQMEWTPFHYYCRTTIAMVPLDYADDDLTKRIKSDAQSIIEKKKKP